jgi:hypothetical protein
LALLEKSRRRGERLEVRLELREALRLLCDLPVLLLALA